MALSQKGLGTNLGNRMAMYTRIVAKQILIEDEYYVQNQIKYIQMLLVSIYNAISDYIKHYHEVNLPRMALCFADFLNRRNSIRNIGFHFSRLGDLNQKLPSQHEQSYHCHS